MARSTDQLVRDTIGNQAVQIISLTAENEKLKEELDNLKKLIPSAPDKDA
jgi:hypothetical protein